MRHARAAGSYAKSTLYELDFVGSQPQFSVNSQSNYKTCIGAIVTLASVAIFVLGSYNFIRNYFDDENPEVDYHSGFNTTNSMNLYTENFFPALCMVSASDQIKLDPNTIDQYATFFFAHVHHKKIINPVSKRPEVNITETYFGSIKCSSLDTFDSRYNYIKNETTKEFVKNYCFCPSVTTESLNNTSIYGTPDSSEYSFISMRLGLCSLPPAECKSRIIFQEGNFGMIYPVVEFDYKNYQNPLEFREVFHDFSPDQFSVPTFFITLGEYNVKNNLGKIRGEKQIAKFVGATKFQSEVISDGSISFVVSRHCDLEKLPCATHAKIDLGIGAASETYIRHYPSFFYLMGGIGGLFQMVFTLMSSFGILFSTFFFKKYMANQIFNLESKEIPDRYRWGNKVKKEDRGWMDERFLKNKDYYQELVNRNMDMVALFQKLNNLEVVSRCFFKDYQLALFPIISAEVLTKDLYQKHNKKNKKKGELDDKLFNSKKLKHVYPKNKLEMIQEGNKNKKDEFSDVVDNDADAESYNTNFDTNSEKKQTFTDLDQSWKNEKKLKSISEAIKLLKSNNEVKDNLEKALDSFFLENLPLEYQTNFGPRNTVEFSKSMSLKKKKSSKSFTEQKKSNFGLVENKQ